MSGFYVQFLKLQGVRELAVTEGKIVAKVALELGSLLDRTEKTLIDSPLVSTTAGRKLCLLLLRLVSKESTLVLGTASLILTEVLVVNVFGELKARDIHMSRCSNHVAVVNATEGDTVDLVGTSDKEKTRLKLLQQNNTTTTEASSQQDENSTGHKAGAKAGRASMLVVA